MTGLERAGEVGVWDDSRVSSCVTLGMVGIGRLKVVGFIWDVGPPGREWDLTDAQSTDTRAQGQARD